MTPLRFCLLTTFYPPFNFGGDGIDIQRTARALTKRGHHVTVIHDVNAYEWLAWTRLPDQPVDQEGVEVIGLRSRFGVLSPFLTHQLGRPVLHSRRIKSIIRERRFDVVVFNNISLVGGPGLLTFGGDALKLYMAHEHWLVCPTHVLWRFNREPCDARKCTRCVVSYGRPLQLWRYTGALTRRLPNVDMFVARSEFSRDKHKEFGFPRPMSVLPYFLSGTIPEEPPSRTTAAPHDRPYFLSVGRLTSIKGLDRVIPAFKQYPDADFLIIGDGEELTPLRIQAAGMPNVKFIGRVPNDQLREFYEHAIAVIAPSAGFETFGLILIEAFRNRTPVIARGIGPFPEIIRQSQGGMLFRTNDELIAAMASLQSDPALRNRMADSGYAACRERWSEDVVINGFLDLVGQGMKAR